MWFLALSSLAVGMVAAQGPYEKASFGQNARLSPNDYAIPAWHIMGGSEWIPQLMSDKVMLTPPAPGNKQGALWTDSSLPLAQWNVDFEFRATGPEHGAGNLQIWYTKENQAQIGTSSIYTVDKFEGLALVVDMSGGRGGSIRGFLNDGTTKFSTHHHIEGLAFGHCDYSYRNLGRPSKLTLKQDGQGFEVLVDDKRCFRSDSVLLPADNYFGVTAASSENPDSFEVFKFVTTPLAAPGGSYSNPPRTHHEREPYTDINNQNQRQQPLGGANSGSSSNRPADVPADVSAATIRSQDAQFADLHDRMQALAHSVDSTYRELQRFSERLQARMEELSGPLARAEQVGALAKAEQVGGLDAKVKALQTELESVKRGQADAGKQFAEIHNALRSRHDMLMEGLPESMSSIISSHGPNMKLFLFLMVAFQLLLAGAYVIYKKRLASGPKKYL